jgi:hypothetical protein
MAAVHLVALATGAQWKKKNPLQIIAEHIYRMCSFKLGRYNVPRYSLQILVTKFFISGLY